MASDWDREIWTLDQIAKSEFFHQKLHEWNLSEIVYELDHIRGERFKWNLEMLGISRRAWNKVIHKGIKPVKVFSHPEVLKENPKRLAYYRMLAMVSQKSMAKIGLSVASYERGGKEFDDDAALRMSRHLNRIISILVENDENIDEREFDLWRGMAAGAQAQGSWQNMKGNKVELSVRELLQRRIVEKELIEQETVYGRVKTFKLKDGRVFRMGSEPDIGIYRAGKIQIAVEIKGGIDTSGALERFGAALKSLRRAKQENEDSTTVLIMQRVSLTPQAEKEISISRSVIDHFFALEDILTDSKARDRLFEILGI